MLESSVLGDITISLKAACLPFEEIQAAIAASAYHQYITSAMTSRPLCALLPVWGNL